MTEIVLEGPKMRSESEELQLGVVNLGVHHVPHRNETIPRYLI